MIPELTAMLALGLTSSYYDAKTKQIPLLLSYTFLIVGMAFGVRDVIGVASVLIALGFGYLLWVKGAWGAADARFLAGLQAWSLSFTKEPFFFLGVFVVSGLLLLAWCSLTKQKLSTKNLFAKQKKHAFTPFMLAGFAFLLVLKILAR